MLQAFLKIQKQKCKILKPLPIQLLRAQEIVISKLAATNEFLRATNVQLVKTNAQFAKEIAALKKGTKNQYHYYQSCGIYSDYSSYQCIKKKEEHQSGATFRDKQGRNERKFANS